MLVILINIYFFDIIDIVIVNVSNDMSFVYAILIMKNLIVEWYDKMIELNEETENYEACAYFKTSKQAFLEFQNEGSVLFRGKRYSPEQVIQLLAEEKGLKGVY
jgi:hypothetical protein